MCPSLYGKDATFFWQKFQSYAGNIPNLLIDILSSAGYDCALSLAELDESDIKNIETFVSKNENILKDSAYAVDEIFEFLPGHRKLLLVLKKKAIEFIENNKKKVTNKSENTNSLANSIEEVELLTGDEIVALKIKLVEKLNRRITSYGLNVVFTEENIISSIDAYISQSSRNSRASYKCIVKCVSWEKLVPCTHNKHWETSNFETHLKKHIQPEIRDNSSHNTTTANNTSTSSSSTKIPTFSKEELNKELGLSNK